MIVMHKTCEIIFTFYKMNAGVRTIPLEQGSAIKSVARISAMAQTFPLRPANTQLSIAEDQAVLESMMTDRDATFGQKDASLIQLLKRKPPCTVAACEKALREERRVEADCAQAAVMACPDEDAIPSTSAMTPIVSPRSHHCTARTGTTAFIPHDILKHLSRSPHVHECHHYRVRWRCV